ncbi:MAG TPA: HD domain-containing phosphohydrolase, partial [Thermoanaerobaculia bacterium]|nr:HD domain-containing phosphohydrolase [Thermoanaerobaculia bacterium]
IGFIDMRDKAGKQPFEPADAPKAQLIADRIVELFGNTNIFGHRFISLSNLSGAHAPVSAELPAREPVVSAQAPIREMPAAPPVAATAQGQESGDRVVTTPPPLAAPPLSRPAPPRPKPEAPRAPLPGLASLVIEARTLAGRIAETSAPPSIGENELAAVREVLRSVLLIPGAVAATFSAFGHMGGVQEIAARSTLGEDAKNVLQSKLNVWLSKRGEGGGYVRTAVTTPFGTSTPAITAVDVQKVFTAPVQAGTLRGLYLTVAFAGNPERSGHDMLAVLHAHLQLVIEQAMEHGAIAALQARVAEKLVEPDFARLPALRRHSELVSKLAESFARFLAMTPAEIERARIVGLVHDCGMRLLDYQRLYRKNDLSPEEIGFLREHPSVGAAIVEPLFGAEVARAVLCHHERVDGNGYPNQLRDDEIPLLARLVQLCDAWAAMTDSESYQPPEPPDAATATILRAAGSQFDAALAQKFVEMMRGR